MRLPMIVGLVLALAGCAQPLQPPVGPTEVAPEPLHSLAAVDRFHWNSNATGDTVVSFAFRFLRDSDCHLLVAESSQDLDGAHRQAVLEEGVRGPFLSTGTGGEVAGARAGPVDTPRLAGGGGTTVWGGQQTFPAGVLQLTFMAPAAQWSESSTVLLEGSLGIDLTCDFSFDVTSASAGGELLLLDSANGFGDAYAHAFVVGGATADAHVGLNVTGPEGRLFVVGNGPPVAVITAKAPGQETQWIYPASSFQDMKGGPGRYEVEISGGAVNGDLWIGMYGLAGPLDLREGLRESAVVHFPFG